MPKLRAQDLPQFLQICPPGTLQFGEHFERAQRLGLVDNFFDLIEGTGYPPRVQTPTLDRWNAFNRQFLRT